MFRSRIIATISLLTAILLIVSGCSAGNNNSETSTSATVSVSVVENDTASAPSEEVNKEDVTTESKKETETSSLETENEEMNDTEPESEQDETEGSDQEVYFDNADDVKEMMENSEEFQVWRSSLTFMPDFDSEDNFELVKNVIGCGRYYSIGEMVGGNSPINFNEGIMHWYLTNIFHISESQYEEYKAIFADANASNDKSVPWYAEGEFINPSPGGYPAVGVMIRIDLVESDADRWILTYHLCDDETEKDIPGSAHQAVMDQQEIDGKIYWTIYSLKTLG